MKSIVFLLAFVAMSTSLFAQQQVLGQSPRSARIYMAQKQHIVLGQSPRSAKIYNTRALQGIKGIVSKMAVADNATTLE